MRDGTLSGDATDRRAILRATTRAIRSYYDRIATLPVAHSATPAAIRDALAPFDFTAPVDSAAAIEFAAHCLTEWSTHALHPSHFGLFVPGTTPIGVAADALAAAFNPAVGAWDLSPAAVEIERHVVRAFGSLFGFRDSGGTLTNGAAEANHTAMLCALARRVPRFATSGVAWLARRPVVYVSSQAHHSLVKAALACGLGTDAIRRIAVARNHAMDVAALNDAIAHDSGNGFLPLMICATVGTTSSGGIDPLRAIARVAAASNAWLHVDAAWAGAAILLRELAALFDGVDAADSLAFDPHKWLSVPIGAGLLLTKNADSLRRTFATSSTPYMPATRDDASNPYEESLQWSRRFAGLKVFLALAVTGWSGYEREIRRQTELGDRLRALLADDSWEIVNRTPLPLVCFRDASNEVTPRQIVAAVNAGGRAWLSVTTLPEGEVIRSCITSHLTTSDHVTALAALLHETRARLRCASASR